jgi:tetratricopeptide (TPR) repeat protein
MIYLGRSTLGGVARSVGSAIGPRLTIRAGLTLGTGLLALVLAGGGCSPTGAGGGQPTSAQFAEIRSQDIDSAARLAMEGNVGYQADTVREGGFQYCQDSNRLAERGEFRLAIRAAAKALYLGQLQNDEDLLSQANRDLAYAYFLAGAPDRAEVFARKAINHASHVTGTRGFQTQRQAQKVLADALLSEGREGEARPIYEALLASADRSRPSAILLSALGNAYLADGQTAKARELFTSAVKVAQGPQRSMALRGLAKTAYTERRYSEAEQLYQQAEQAANGEDQEYSKVLAISGAARSYYAMGDLANATTTYMRALDLAEGLASRFRSEEFRGGFFGGVSDIFDEAVFALAQAGQGEKAFEVSERGRARALLDLVEGRVEISAGAVAVARRAARPATASQVEASLPPRTVMVSYDTTPNGTVVWVIRASGVETRIVPGDRPSFREQTLVFRAAVRARSPDWQSSADGLGQQLLSFVALGPGETVVIVPHGPLHYLPFEALRVGGTELGAAHPISYSPSASLFVDVVSRLPSSRTRAVGLGDPDLGNPRYDLPGARREVEELKRIYTNAKVMVGKDANKPNLFSSAPTADIMHIAAHADVDEIDPLYSTIYLSDTPSASGRLEAHEIYNLDLDRRALVTLSACETGLGRVLRGDEQYGFVRTFFSAGADTAIVSLWPVSDEATERLMETFYDKLRDHGTAEALHLAEASLRKDPRFQQPFFWAAFQLIGDPR